MPLRAASGSCFRAAWVNHWVGEFGACAETNGWWANKLLPDDFTLWFRLYEVVAKEIGCDQKNENNFKPFYSYIVVSLTAQQPQTALHFSHRISGAEPPSASPLSTRDPPSMTIRTKLLACIISLTLIIATVTAFTFYAVERQSTITQGIVD